MSQTSINRFFSMTPSRFIIWFTAFCILNPDVRLPFKVDDIRVFHYEEWDEVYQLLKKRSGLFEAIYFAFSRPIDALAINWRFSKRFYQGKTRPMDKLSTLYKLLAFCSLSGLTRCLCDTKRQTLPNWCQG